MQRTPHFYKLHSRMGMKHPPIYTNELNLGVEEGPSAILTNDFLEHFPTYNFDEFIFSDPQKIPDDEFINTLVNESSNVIHLIDTTYATGETQVVVGGDHSVAFSSIVAVLKRFSSDDIGYVQIDSHTDMNRHDESISKNWHGMYLRPLLDGFDIDEINALVSQKLAHQNVTFIGNLDAEPLELAFFKKCGLKNITVKQAREGHEFEKLFARLSKLKHLHISIDIDGFDGSVAPATGLPAQHGLLRKDIQPLFEFAKTFPSLSIDLVEVNPQKNGAAKTIMFAQKILLDLLS